MCDLETSRMGAPYIYDISRLRVNDRYSCRLLWSDKCTILKRIEFIVKIFFEEEVENTSRNVGIRRVKRKRKLLYRDKCVKGRLLFYYVQCHNA